MSVNLNKSGLGKFAGMRGTIFKSEIAAAKPSKQIVGKGRKLLRRLVRWRREICLMVSLSGSRTISHMKL